LRYDNGQKLATTSTGIDVTGTVTADGLTVSGSSTSTFNSGAENVVATFTSTDTEAQINLVDTTGSAQIRSRNDLRFYTNGGSTRAMDIDSSGNVGIGGVPATNSSTLQITDDATTSNNLQLVLAGSTNTSKQMILGFDTTADKSFITSQIAGSAQKPLIINASAVGIGTSSPAKKLHVDSGNDSDIARFENDSGSFTLGKSANLGSLDMASDADFRIRHGGTVSATFKSDGKVGIGTSSPDTMLTVDTNVGGSSTGTLARFHASKGESDSTFLQIAATRHGTASVQRVQLQAFDDDGSTGRTLALNPSGGSVGIGTNSPSRQLSLSHASQADISLLSGSDTNGGLIYHNASEQVVLIANRESDGHIAFQTGGTTERMKIDASGYVTTPYQPAFKANATTQTNLGTNWQKVLYGNSVTARNGTGSTAYANSRFTAPVAGWYFFSASYTATANADADGTFSIGINGSQSNLVSSTTAPSTSGHTYNPHFCSGTAYLAAGDFVEVYRYATVTTTTRTGVAYGGWFSGFLTG